MDIQIKNESAALTSCEELAKHANAMNEDITTLETNLSRIKDGLREIFCSFAIFIETVSKFPKNEQQHSSLPHIPFPPKSFYFVSYSYLS